VFTRVTVPSGPQATEAGPHVRPRSRANEVWQLNNRTDCAHYIPYYFVFKMPSNFRRKSTKKTLSEKISCRKIQFTVRKIWYFFREANRSSGKLGFRDFRRMKNNVSNLGCTVISRTEKNVKKVRLKFEVTRY